MSDDSSSSDTGNESSSPERNYHSKKQTEEKKDREEVSSSSKSKISMSMKKPFSIGLAKKPGPPIQIKFNNTKIPTAAPPPLKRPSSSVAAVFGDISDEEPEEMPPEARMRMRNMGRNTPTSAGPNSFGKTKYGFVDTKKMFEKNLKEAALELCDEEKERKKKRLV